MSVLLCLGPNARVETPRLPRSCRVASACSPAAPSRGALLTGLTGDPGSGSGGGCAASADRTRRPVCTHPGEPRNTHPARAGMRCRPHRGRRDSARRPARSRSVRDRASAHDCASRSVSRARPRDPCAGLLVSARSPVHFLTLLRAVARVAARPPQVRGGPPGAARTEWSKSGGTWYIMATLDPVQKRSSHSGGGARSGVAANPSLAQE